MKKIKKHIVNLIEILYLIKKHKNDYKRFFLNDYRTLKKRLNTEGFDHISISNADAWKIWYNCCYLKGYYKKGTEKKRVFIKVMGPLISDCYTNEILLNEYLDENSVFLSKRVPKIITTFQIGDYYIIISEFVKLAPIERTSGFIDDLKQVLEEYKRIGIIHTDFRLSNMGFFDGINYFFDYGTSICSKSNMIRIRRGNTYNHIQQITNTAKKILPDAEYYYDDVIHLGINHEGIDRESVNFIVGKKNDYYVRLNNQILNFQLVQMENSGSVYLLKRKTQ